MNYLTTAVIIFIFIKTASYSFFLKNENPVGAISVFFLAVLSLAVILI